MIALPPAASDSDRVRSKIDQLVEKYAKVDEGTLTEEDTKVGFVLPLLAALGWKAEGSEVLQAELSTLSGRTDIALRLDSARRPCLLIEVKKMAESLDGDRPKGPLRQSFAEQAINDAWQLKVDFAILTNFKELRLYATHFKKPEDGLIFSIPCRLFTDATHLPRLLQLAKWNVENGSLEALETKGTRSDVNEEILRDLFQIRSLLVKAIRTNNARLDPDLLHEGVQRIIDRLVVIRTSEDRGIVQQDTLNLLFETWDKVRLNKEQGTFFHDLATYFRDFDDVYNSSLFAKHPLEGWKLPNQEWLSIIKFLYKYNFDAISADLLGSVYEDYIGHVLKLKESGELEHFDTRRIQQAGGIFYTPSYLVDYVVWKTLGRILGAKQAQAAEAIAKGDYEGASAIREEVKAWRILDPACGSGSFLIKVFDYLASFYSGFNAAVRRRKGDLKAVHYFFDDWATHILTNQLFGVDLDPQAAEIASMNLILKAIKRDQRLPTVLGKTVVSANSLLFGTRTELDTRAGPRWKTLRPIQWKETWPKIFETGGFDFVVGNPPWGAKLDAVDFLKWRFPKTATGQFDSFELFIELADHILKPGGRQGFVLPATLFYPEHERTRRYIMDNAQIDTVVQCGEKFFPNINMATCLVVFERNGAKP